MVAPVYDKEDNSNYQHVWTYEKVSKNEIVKKKGPPLPFVDVQDSKKQVKRGEENAEIKE
jgi:hypothetical protein